MTDSNSAFELLHPGVQKQLWRMKWASLRPLQVQAIHHMSSGGGHAILSAATAAGKTEAAFLPVLSQIADLPPGSVRAVYVGPLKALINDQFRRVEDLCGYLELPVFRWHGDVPASQKSRLLREPAGVLLITPESLESLLVNRSANLQALFGGLKFVVIDELHSFLDSERGLHLRSLLARLGDLIASASPPAPGPAVEAPPWGESPQRPPVPDREPAPPFRLIGLSATIGDFSLAQRFLDPRRPQAVQVITDAAAQKEVRYKIHGYLAGAAGQDAAAPAAAPAAGDDASAQQVPPHRLALAGDIVTHCAGQSNLVFANSRADVEELGQLAADLARRRGLDDPFLVHHGSLSVEIREDAEETMKSARSATTFCSSTLEMGIDIGSVKMVGQVGPCWSVASLAQRLGRSGRRDGEPRILRVYIECDACDERSGLLDRLCLQLVQACALSELLRAKWVEPARLPVCDLSTLTHQIISVIAQTGGVRAAELHRRLCACGAFADIEPALLARLLRRLGSADVIEQVSGGGELILGLVGEQLRKDRSFYAVFPTAVEYAISHQGKVLGTLQMAPRQGEHLLFAGRRWKVQAVDEARREVEVVPAAGYRKPHFTGGPGQVHARVRETMRDVLAGNEVYPYLDPVATGLLAQARAQAADAGLCERRLVELAAKRTALMTWTGTRTQETLKAMLLLRQIDAVDEGVALVLPLPVADVRTLMGDIARGEHDAFHIASCLENRLRRKYDYLLDDDLLNVSLARGEVDVEGARAIAAQAAEGEGTTMTNDQ